MTNTHKQTLQRAYIKTHANTFIQVKRMYTNIEINVLVRGYVCVCVYVCLRMCVCARLCAYVFVSVFGCM